MTKKKAAEKPQAELLPPDAKTEAAAPAPKSTAVAPARRQAPAKAAAVTTSEAGTILAVIARAAADPAVQVDKMQQLLAMHREIEDRNAQRAFDIAFAEMQDKMPTIGKRGEIKITDKENRQKVVQATKYALWDDINKVIKPILTEHGFALRFRTGREADQVIVTAILSHREGHREETTMRLPLDTTGSKNNVQAVGSSTQYGKRYAGGAILNITFEGEDDDGAAAGNTPEQRRVEGTQDRLDNLANQTSAAAKKKEPKGEEQGESESAEPKKEAAAPKARKTKPAPPPGENYEAFRKDIVAKLAKCESEKHVTALWGLDVEPWQTAANEEHRFFPPDFDDTKRLFEEKRAEIRGG